MSTRGKTQLAQNTPEERRFQVDDDIEMEDQESETSMEDVEPRRPGPARTLFHAPRSDYDTQ